MPFKYLLSAAALTLALCPPAHAVEGTVTWHDPTCGYFVLTLPGAQEEKFGLFSWKSGPDPKMDQVWEGDIDGALNHAENLPTEGAEAMHHQLMSEGVAHFGGPLLVEVDGDQATAVSYSLIMRRDGGRYYLWRVSAVRWDLDRTDSGWLVQRRTNRLLDDAGHGLQRFEERVPGDLL